MNNKPQISILLPVYNSQQYISEAIESILNQSFQDYELIIINDGSTDNSVDIIRMYNDERIVFLSNIKNLGLTQTLNNGIIYCKGKYIARMDADDISHKNRLKLQYDFMEKNPEIGVCGSWVKIINDKYKAIWTYPLKNEEIKSELIFSSPFAHPSVIIRKEVLEKNNIKYNLNYNTAQDYELWSRLIKITNFSNIPKCLLFYRIHDSQIGRMNFNMQKFKTKQIRDDLLRSFGIENNDLHDKIVSLNKITETDLFQIKEYMEELVNRNEIKCVFNSSAFKKTITNHWISCCSHCNTDIYNRFKIMLSFKYFQFSSIFKKIVNTLVKIGF